jgi:hypothetical protein
MCVHVRCCIFAAAMNLQRSTNTNIVKSADTSATDAAALPALSPATCPDHAAQPQLKDMQKEVLRYKRSDGVDLTGTLYLPPGYDAVRDGPLPTILWAYPREYKSKVRGKREAVEPVIVVEIWLAVAAGLLAECDPLLLQAMCTCGESGCYGGNALLH